MARAVKKAGRGAHVDLKCEGAQRVTSSLYKSTFCAHHDAAAASLGADANPAAYAMVRGTHAPFRRSAWPVVGGWLAGWAACAAVPQAHACFQVRPDCVALSWLALSFPACPPFPHEDTQYEAAKVDAKANKALGTGSSVNLSFMW